MEGAYRKGQQEEIMAKKSSKDDNKAELQAKYIQFELLGREFEQIEAQRQLVELKAKELKILRDSIDHVIKGEGFSQLGEGIYVPSKFTEADSFIVDVGKKIFVKMDKTGAKKYLEKKVKEFDDALEKIDCRCQEISVEIQKQAADLQGI